MIARQPVGRCLTRIPRARIERLAQVTRALEVVKHHVNCEPASHILPEPVGTLRAVSCNKVSGVRIGIAKRYAVRFATRVTCIVHAPARSGIVDQIERITATLESWSRHTSKRVLRRFLLTTPNSYPPNDICSAQ